MAAQGRVVFSAAALFLRRRRVGTTRTSAHRVDDTKGTVTHGLLGALSQGNVGMVLTRALPVRGNTLLITLETTAADGTPVIRTLTWERAGEPA